MCVESKNLDSNHGGEDVNAELAALFAEDQRDRAGWAGDLGELQAIHERDRMRRERALALIAEGALTAAEDFFHAAMLLQHSDQPEDFRLAHELAVRAVELGHPEEKRARWLAAATLDRWLTSQGKPQKYGTQFFKDKNGWRLLPVAPDTTDAERAEWGVPPLSETLRRLEELRRMDP